MKSDQPGDKEQAGAAAPSAAPRIVELRPDIFQFRSDKPGSHIYLIKGDAKNALIDTGTAGHFPVLKKRLSEVGLRVRDIQLILLTHEHFDHAGATAFFHETAVVAAHRLAANKLQLQDDFVTLSRYYDVPGKPFWVDVWLEDGAVIDLGKHKLRVVHTPGHTSGCICLHELGEGLLFAGDTVFAGGTLSQITGSGSVSDYMESVQRLSNLRIKTIYPGHGRSSDAPTEDLPRAVEYAAQLLADSMLFLEAFIKTRQLKGKMGYWHENP